MSNELEYNQLFVVVHGEAYIPEAFATKAEAEAFVDEIGDEYISGPWAVNAAEKGTFEAESFSLPAGLLEEADKDDNGLDDVVHDIISKRASGINNEGFKAQIEFIIEELGQEAGLKAVKEALEG